MLITTWPPLTCHDTVIAADILLMILTSTVTMLTIGPTLINNMSTYIHTYVATYLCMYVRI